MNDKTNVFSLLRISSVSFCAAKSFNTLLRIWNATVKPLRKYCVSSSKCGFLLILFERKSASCCSGRSGYRLGQSILFYGEFALNAQWLFRKASRLGPQNPCPESHRKNTQNCGDGNGGCGQRMANTKPIGNQPCIDAGGNRRGQHHGFGPFR